MSGIKGKKVRLVIGPSAVFLPLGRGLSGRRKRSLLDAGGRAAPVYRVRVYSFKAAPDLGAGEP